LHYLLIVVNTSRFEEVVYDILQELGYVALTAHLLGAEIAVDEGRRHGQLELIPNELHDGCLHWVHGDSSQLTFWL